MLKKISCIFALVLAISMVLVSCSQGNNQAVNSNTSGDIQESNDKKIKVVSTIFAPYDFVRQIAGENAKISMLLSPGAESHSFEPTPQDIMKIQNADMFVYVGGDSDNWVHEKLEDIDTDKTKIITLMDCVDLVKEEIVEGMEHSHDHEHSHGDEEFSAGLVQERSMEEFTDSWISGVPLINDGSLDDYLKHSAEENEVDFEKYKAETLEKWEFEYDNIQIDKNKLTISGKTAEYQSKGYEIVESETSSSVWYKYQKTSGDDSLPVYLMFNDHNYKNAENHDDEHGEEHEHEEVAHTHLKYGNKSFADLLESKSAGFYFDSAFSNKEIGEFMAGHDHSHEEEFDEHVWTSPKNAKHIVEKISNALCEIDSENADIYRANTTEYIGKLDELDKNIKDVVDSSARKVLIFGDRFPLRYFVDAYGLDYYAAFSGCSIETDASAATVAFLIDKIKEKIPAVFHIELSNHEMADTISEATGAKVLEFHSVHNISKEDFENGADYIALMYKNIASLKEALN